MKVKGLTPNKVALLLVISLLFFSRFALADDKTVNVEVPVSLQNVSYMIKDFYVMHAFTVNGKVVLKEDISKVKFQPTPAPTGDPKNKKINFSGKITLKLKPEVGLAPGTKVDYVCILMLNRAEGFYGRPARPKWILAVPEDWWEPAELAAVEDYWTDYEYLAEQDGSSWTTLPALIPIPTPLGMMGEGGDSSPVGVVGVDGTIEFQPGKTMTVSKIVMTGIKGPATFEDIPEEIKERFKKKVKFKKFKYEVDKRYLSAPDLQMTGMYGSTKTEHPRLKLNLGPESGPQGMERGAPGAQESTQPGTRTTSQMTRIPRIGGAAPTESGAGGEEEIR